MSGLGTDMLALTCILGGAAVGGVATMALMESRGDVDARVTEIRCVQERVEAPRVIVTSGRSDRTVIVHSFNDRAAATCDAVMAIPRSALTAVPSIRVEPSADMVVELERRLEAVMRDRAVVMEQQETLERMRIQIRQARVEAERVRVRERVRR